MSEHGKDLLTIFLVVLILILAFGTMLSEVAL